LLLGLLLAVSVTSHVSRVRANDGVMGGAGSDLVPMKTAHVSMASEDIQLTYDSGEWHVEADYVFRNNSKAEQTLQLGFPEYRCEDEEASCTRDSAFHFEDMTTLVRGVSVKHRKGTIKKDHAWAPKLGNVWLFDVSFAPGESLPVRHTYRVPSSGDSGGGTSTRYVTHRGFVGRTDRACALSRTPADAGHRLHGSGAVACSEHQADRRLGYQANPAHL